MRLDEASGSDGYWLRGSTFAVSATDYVRSLNSMLNGWTALMFPTGCDHSQSEILIGVKELSSLDRTRGMLAAWRGHFVGRQSRRRRDI